MKIKLGILAALLAGSFGAAGGPAGDCGLAQVEWKLGTQAISKNATANACWSWKYRKRTGTAVIFRGRK